MTCVAPVLVAFSTAQEDSPPDLHNLAWMAGCWEITTETSLTEEHWTAPDAGSMLGVNRLYRSSKLWSTEFMKIVEDSAGVTLIAKPQNQAEASFRATEINQSRVVFDNPAHDFPRRIVYENRSPDSLFAWISEDVSFEGRRIVFPFVRASCND